MAFWFLLFFHEYSVLDKLVDGSQFLTVEVVWHTVVSIFGRASDGEQP
jgi:hypothetical protein